MPVKFDVLATAQPGWTVDLGGGNVVPVAAWGAEKNKDPFPVYVDPVSNELVGDDSYVSISPPPAPPAPPTPPLGTLTNVPPDEWYVEDNGDWKPVVAWTAIKDGPNNVVVPVFLDETDGGQTVVGDGTEEIRTGQKVGDLRGD